VAGEDALERLTRLAMRRHVAAAVPDLLAAVHDVRLQATARLAASQCKINAAQSGYLKVLAAFTLLAQPLVHVGNDPGVAAVETAAEGLLFALLTGIVTVCVAVTDDLASPNDGLYTVAPVRATLTAALLRKSDSIAAAARLHAADPARDEHW
jgi:hypothetical protein